MIFDWTDLIPTTRTGWMLAALFGLPLLGAIILGWAMLRNAGA
jgi:hypothetical protein